MAEPTIPEINRNIAWMRGNLQSTPKGMHPEIAQMVRDVRNMYFAPADRPVGATPAMQSAVQGQPLGVAQEPVRPVPGMRTLGSEMGARVPPGYSGPRPAPQVGEMMGRMQDPRMSLSDMIRGMGGQSSAPANATSEALRTAGGLRQFIKPGVSAAGRLAGPVAAAGLGAMDVYSELKNPESRLSQTLTGTGKQISDVYGREGILPAAATAVGAAPWVIGEAARAAIAPAAKELGALKEAGLRGFMGGAAATPATAMPANAAPTTTTIPAEALSARPMAGAPAMATSAAAAGPQTVRIHRMGSGGGLTTTYDVSPGAPIGKVLSVEGMPPGLTPQEYLYNLQALKSANIAANQQRAAANSIIGSLRQGMLMDKESGQFLAGLAQAAGKGVEPVRPQLQKASQEKQPDLAQRAGYDASQLLLELDADLTNRVQQIQAANPRMTPEQIAADPQVRQNRLRKQQVQAQFNRMIELSGKRLPTLDQSMAIGGTSGE